MNVFIKKLLRESLLKEKSISDVSLIDFNLKDIARYWVQGNTETVVSEYQYEMQDDYALTPEEKELIMDTDIDDILETDNFKRWLAYEVEYKVENFIREIDNFIKDDETIDIWREMTVDQDWLNRLSGTGKRLGKYWSFDEGAAEAHWGGREKFRIKIKSSIKQSYVDWNQTIEANIDPSLGEQEKEITLFKNTPIKIEVLWINNEQKDISLIKNKVFLA